MQQERNLRSAVAAPSAVFVQHALVAAGIFSLVYLLWQIRSALLLVLAGSIVAVVLLAAAKPIKRRTKLSGRWPLTIAEGRSGSFSRWHFGWSAANYTRSSLILPRGCLKQCNRWRDGSPQLYLP